MTDTLGVGIGTGLDAYGNTHVSYPGGQAMASPVAAPGANGPLGSLGVNQAVLVVAGTSIAFILVLGYLFRHG